MAGDKEQKSVASAKVLKLVDLADYQEDSVVSRSARYIAGLMLS